MRFFERSNLKNICNSILIKCSTIVFLFLCKKNLLGLSDLLGFGNCCERVDWCGLSSFGQQDFSASMVSAVLLPVKKRKKGSLT